MSSAASGFRLVQAHARRHRSENGHHGAIKRALVAEIGAADQRRMTAKLAGEFGLECAIRALRLSLTTLRGNLHAIGCGGRRGRLRRRAGGARMAVRTGSDRAGSRD